MATVDNIAALRNDSRKGDTVNSLPLVDQIAALRNHPVEVRNDWHNVPQRDRENATPRVPVRNDWHNVTSHDPVDALPVVVRTSDNYRVAYRITWPKGEGTYQASTFRELGHALVAVGYREYLWDDTRNGGGFRRFIVP